MMQELAKVHAHANVRPGSSFLTEVGYVWIANDGSGRELLTPVEWLRRMGFDPEITTCSLHTREGSVLSADSLAVTSST